MTRSRRWSDLSDRDRGLIVVVVALEGVLKVAALIDLKRRPAGEVRGRRWVWATAITFANSLGVVPVAYFVLGRRRP